MTRKTLDDIDVQHVLRGMKPPSIIIKEQQAAEQAKLVKEQQAKAQAEQQKVEQNRLKEEKMKLDW